MHRRSSSVEPNQAELTPPPKMVLWISATFAIFADPIRSPFRIESESTFATFYSLFFRDALWLPLLNLLTRTAALYVLVATLIHH
ncbi:MAG: hypothetical protein OXC80_04170 [Gammaproteobacteria bacterium]|nr:hypothetical protein [Gammaproteobacteria bacterium]